MESKQIIFLVFLIVLIVLFLIIFWMIRRSDRDDDLYDQKWYIYNRKKESNNKE